METVFLANEPKVGRLMIFDGNSTRYYFSLVKSSEFIWLAINLNDYRVTEFSSQYLGEDYLSNRFSESGYSQRDAEVIALHLIVGLKKEFYYEGNL